MTSLAPKFVKVLSAHCCIAEFEGVDAGVEIARFRIDRYLRYAHLVPERASGLVKTFELRLASADQLTAILAAETGGDDAVLSRAIAGLAAGDKVELEWRQLRVEVETDVDEDQFSIVEQVNKLEELDAAAERELVKAWPQPQIMIYQKKRMCVKCP